ncbi:MAG TPA: NADPH-dependent F420 reductase [Terriglobales bacterium]|nr:NADPH-dependent F420 reductase [Terriglobales bacterium]
MKIAVLGAGNVGGALGKLWAGRGHEVRFGVPDAGSEKIKTLLASTGGKAQAGRNREAAAASEVVVLSVPWPAAEQAIRDCGDIKSKVVIDCTNPLRSDFKGLEVGTTTSAAEQVAAWSGAKVVKAFNTIGAGNYGRAEFAGTRADGFYCGDDAAAKDKVKPLIADIGLNPVDVGPLRNARLLEPLAMLWIDLAINQKWGPNHAFKLLRR